MSKFKKVLENHEESNFREERCARRDMTAEARQLESAEVAAKFGGGEFGGGPSSAAGQVRRRAKFGSGARVVLVASQSSGSADRGIWAKSPISTPFKLINCGNP